MIYHDPPRVGRADESELLVRSYHDDPQPADLDRIVTSLDWMVRAVARRAQWHDEPIDDLTQIARMGLLAAIDRFDPERGVAFHTFAHATMMGMLQHHHRNALQMKVPRGVQDLNAACRHAVEQLTATLRRVPTVAEVAHTVGVPEREAADAMAVDVLFHPVSLSSSNGDDDNEGDTLDARLGGDDIDLERTADRTHVQHVLTTLPSRQRTIVFLHFYDGRTQAEIGAQLGISQVQVSRLMARALAAIRQQVAADEPVDGIDVRVELAKSGE